MTAGVLLLPAIVVGAFVLLFATTCLERVIGLRRSALAGREETPCTSAWEPSC